jgi:hypothetical protein
MPHNRLLTKVPACLNARPLICRGGAGGFACAFPISQPFSALPIAAVAKAL